MQILPTGDSTVYDKHLNACVMNSVYVAASYKYSMKHNIFSIKAEHYTIGDTTISTASFACIYKGTAKRKNDRITQEIKARGLRSSGA
jgi:hypothetical protein